MQSLLPVAVSPSVRAEQIRLLYHQGASIQMLGIATACVSVITLWGIANQTRLLIWLSVMIGISVIRLAANTAFSIRDVPDRETGKWGTFYIAGTFVSGLIWGSLALFFDPSWPTPYQVILFVVFTGLIGGAFNTNSSLFVAYPAFYLPLVVCLMYVTLRQQEQGFYALSILFVIYTVLMYVSSLKFHNRLAHALELRFVNEHLAADLAQSNEKLTELADKDELTHLYNRRSMNRYLNSEWNRLRRSGEPLSLLFVDLDRFKQYNDTYGHDGGDQCLIQVGRILQNHSRRSTDMAARFGGEEFAVILPETGLAEALNIANAIRAELNASAIPHASSSVAKHVTASIGVASMVPRQDDQASLLRARADKALYQAKNGGRDRVVPTPD